MLDCMLCHGLANADFEAISMDCYCFDYVYYSRKVRYSASNENDDIIAFPVHLKNIGEPCATGFEIKNKLTTVNCSDLALRL